MLAHAMRSPLIRPRGVCASVLFVVLIGITLGQDPAAPSRTPDANAIQLPDGTIVFITKSPEDANPKVDGVLLSAKEYQALVEKAEQLKKNRETARPMAPSMCHIRGRVMAKGDRPYAQLTLDYAFRTIQSRTSVFLGGQRAYLMAARMGEGGLPLLEATADGLTVLVDTPGEHRLTLEMEIPVTAKGGKAEIGFDLGLPRAAITTLSLEPPTPDTKRISLTTRSPDPATGAKNGDVRRVVEDVERFQPREKQPGPALGPVDSVEVSWESVSSVVPATTETPLAVETEISVRIEDTSVDTTARMRLKGPPREWTMQLPPNANVSVERSGGPATNATRGPSITRPSDNAAGSWVILTPDSGEWIVTVTQRDTRNQNPQEAAEPLKVGPFYCLDAPRQSGVIRVHAPVSLHVSAQVPREMRRQDIPAGMGEDLPTLLYRYAAVPLRDNRPVPLLELQTRPARGTIVTQTAHQLRLVESGWRIRSELKVTPIRMEASEFTVELPAGWQNLDVLPPELVEEVIPGPDRTFTVRLATPQKSPFDLVLEAIWPLAANVREVTVPMPRFPGVTQRQSQVTVTVPDGIEVLGRARDGASTDPGSYSAALSPAVGLSASQITGTFDSGIAEVQLNWQPYRSPLTVEILADLTLYKQQLEVTQTIKITASEGLPRSIRFRGVSDALNWDAPALEPTGIGEWAFLPAPGQTTSTLTLRYALPLTTEGTPVGFIWPDATRVATTVRMWSRDQQRVTRFEGPWLERPPELDASRGSLPHLTLTGTGTGLPLTVYLTSMQQGFASVVIERAAMSISHGADGRERIQANFLLRDWAQPQIVLRIPQQTQARITLDQQQVVPLQLEERDGYLHYTIPMPEATRSNPWALLQCQYSTEPRTTPRYLSTIQTPTIQQASLRSPWRWCLVNAPAETGLVLNRDFVPANRWLWSGSRLVPAAAMTQDETLQWVREGAGAEIPAGTNPITQREDLSTITGQTPGDSRLVVARVPWVVWALACSVVVFIAGILISRLRPAYLGPCLAVLAIALAIIAVTYPHVAVQAVAGAQFGAMALFVVLGAHALRRWYYRRTLTHLPTFTRHAPGYDNVATTPAPRSSRSATGREQEANPGSAAPALPPSGVS